MNQKITTPAEAVANSERFTKEQDDYLFTYERKRENRIIALQCAAQRLAGSSLGNDVLNTSTVAIAKRYEKYLEHGE